MNERLAREMTLASEPGQWAIWLMGGETIRLIAHGYSTTEQEYSFSLLMDGDPPFEVEVARLPRSLVRSIDGG
jgi:hypothetical protein